MAINKNKKAKNNAAPPKKEKKPLVNWFSREKEYEYGNKSYGKTDVKTTKKIVKAPDSKLSKGFTKTVEKVSRKTEMPMNKKNKNNKIGVSAMVGGTAITLGGGTINAAIANKKEKKSWDKQNKAVSDYWAEINNRTQGANGDYTAKREKLDNDIARMTADREKNEKRHRNIARGLAAAAPIGYGIGMKMIFTDREKKTRKTVTKVYNDGSGTKTEKSGGKKRVKKFKPTR